MFVYLSAFLLMSEVKFMVEENESTEIQEENDQSSSPMGRRLPKPLEPSFLWWRLTNLLMFIFFSFAAYVQLNDDDACLWILLYSVPTLLSAAVVCSPLISDNRIWQNVAIVHTACSMLMLLYLMVALLREMYQPMKEFTWNVLEYEEGREFLGVTLVVSWLKLCRLEPLTDKGTKSKEPPMERLVFLLIVGLIPMVLWGICFVDGIEQRLSHCKAMYETCSNLKSDEPVIGMALN